MIRNLQDKMCVITGAASGIGRATAIRCAREGARLFLTDINDEGLRETVDMIAHEEVGASSPDLPSDQADNQDSDTQGTKSPSLVLDARAIDISDERAVFEWGREITENFGAVDIVMNIAGISTWGSMKTLEHRHWRQLIEINLMGPIAVLEAFVPAMMNADKPGHIVNVSSAAGLFGLPWHAAYSASKFGLRGISEVLRFDLKHYDIGVSLVCPGAVNTGLVQTVNIVGIDRDNSEVQSLVERFQHRAVSPDKAAKAIIRGIKRGRFMVYTSWDIRIGHWAKRWFALPYRWVMSFMNRKVQRLAEDRGVD